MLTRSQKMYLYSIYMLGQNGNAVRSADVARLVGVSKPSTVKMVQKLVDEQYTNRERDNGSKQALHTKHYSARFSY